MQLIRLDRLFGLFYFPDNNLDITNYFSFEQHFFAFIYFDKHHS